MQLTTIKIVTNPRSIALEASMLTITPPMWLFIN